MLIVMRQGAPKGEIEKVADAVRSQGCQPKAITGGNRTAVCVLGNREALDPAQFEFLPGVIECIPVTKPYKLVNHDIHPENTLVEVNGVVFGDESDKLSIIAGPCAVENWDQMARIGTALNEHGIRLLRGGAFKPRTSPYSFQGLRDKGLEILARIRKEFGLGVVTEAVDHVNFDQVEEVADVVQIGTRNMQNYSLLRRAGKSQTPILLKRGMSATIDEWLMAAEYILAEGNPNVILCERGVRTFSDHTRSTLDLSAVPVVKKMSHLPIIVDPSHAAGEWDFVIPLSVAAKGVGADGLLVEVHPEPEKALSDGAQSLNLKKFEKLLDKVGRGIKG